MNTATHLTPDNHLAFPSMIRPLGRHLGLWLAALRSGLRSAGSASRRSRPNNRADIISLSGQLTWFDQFKCKGIAVVKIRMRGGMAQRPVAVAAIDGIGGFDDRRKAKQKDGAS